MIEETELFLKEMKEYREFRQSTLKDKNLELDAELDNVIKLVEEFVKKEAS